MRATGGSKGSADAGVDGGRDLRGAGLTAFQDFVDERIAEDDELARVLRPIRRGWA